MVRRVLETDRQLAAELNGRNDTVGRTFGAYLTGIWLPGLSRPSTPRLALMKAVSNENEHMTKERRTAPPVRVRTAGD